MSTVKLTYGPLKKFGLMSTVKTGTENDKYVNKN